MPAGPPPGGFIPPVLQGKACVGHPDVQAQYICHRCRTPICVTCAFALPGGVTLCPTCVTRPAPTSASRNGMALGFSFGLAVLAMLGVVGFFAVAGTMGDSPEDFMAIAVIAAMFILLPSVTGLGLGMSTMEKNIPTSIWTWVAIIWNAVILAGFLLLSVVGNLIG